MTEPFECWGHVLSPFPSGGQYWPAHMYMVCNPYSIQLLCKLTDGMQFFSQQMVSMQTLLTSVLVAKYDAVWSSWYSYIIWLTSALEWVSFIINKDQYQISPNASMPQSNYSEGEWKKHHSVAGQGGLAIKLRRYHTHIEASPAPAGMLTLAVHRPKHWDLAICTVDVTSLSPDIQATGLPSESEALQRG